jgi:hypothetical protein
MPAQTISRDELADLVEHHAALFAAAVRQSLMVAAFTEEPPTTAAADDPGSASNIGRGGRPGGWTQIGELPNETYSWPEGVEHYEPFEVWETTDARGRIQVGLGQVTKRGTYYGKERGYWLGFEMVNGQKRRPIVVFMEADDFETTGALVAVMKGKGDGGRSMFAPGDELPAGYEQLKIEVFRDRVCGPQAYNRLAVVAEAGDRQTMCTHVFLQLGLRS